MLIFVSYHTPDHDKARAVEAALAARRPGNEWYFAPRNITGGAWWVPSLGDALARADAVLFLAGRHIGPWQELEYYEALRLSRKQAGRPRLVPVVTTDQAPGLPFFAQFHRIFAADPTAPETLEAIERAFDDTLPPDASPAWQRFQPYKGLPALEEADAAFFFGRDEETAAILDLMARQPDRVIALIGQSGVGKSSLARAGVLARLKSQLWPLETGEWPAGLRDSRAFLPLVVRPGEQPLKELALAFAQLYCTKTFELDEETAGWARRFADGAGLRDMLRATRGKLAEALDAEPPKRFVVYLDQGEELYTRAGPDEARRFSALVAEAAGHEAFSVLMSLRSDYYTAYQNDRAVFDASEHVDVLPLTRDVLGEVIRKPALTLGAHFESDDMAGRVADATEREPGALPLLSDLMHEMWLHMQARGDGVLRWSDNPEIVDVAAPLRRRAEAFLADPANDEAVVRRLFSLRLAHVPETGDPVRRRAHRSECGEAEWAVAEKLADQDWRLLTMARAADGEPIVEVAHEQLLRRWERLKLWLDEEREFLVWRGQAEHAAGAYKALPEAERDGALLMGRPLVIARGWFERRAADFAPDTRDFVVASLAADTARRDAERRRWRIALSATSAGLVGALSFAGVAGWQWREADLQTKETKLQRDRAEHNLTLATQTANGLIYELAQKFRNATGVPAATIKSMLDSARKLQEQLSAGGESTPDLRYSQAVALGESVDTLMTIGDTQGALAAAQRAQAILQSLVDSNPGNTEWQRDLSVSHINIGDVLVAAGRREEALAAYQKSLTIAEKLAAADLGNTLYQSGLSLCHERIGNLLAAAGRREEALAAYQKSLAIAEKFAAADPGNAFWQRDLSVSHEKVGDLLFAAGRREEALAAHQISLAIRESLAATDPGDTQWQRDLSVSHEKVGNLLLAAGRREEAFAAYQKSLAILEKLATADPANAQWQRDLSVSHEKVGNLLFAAGRREEALVAHQKSLAIRESLAATDPGNAEWQRDLSASHIHIGRVLLAVGRPEEALTAYRKALASHEKLANGDPGNTKWERDLAVARSEIGRALAESGQPEEAVAAFEESLATVEKLVDLDPGNAEWQRDLAASHNNIGNVLFDAGRREEALISYQKALAVDRALVEQDPGNVQWQMDLIQHLRNIKNIDLQLGDLADALVSDVERTKICRGLYTASRSIDNQSSLIDALGSLSFVLVLKQQPADALASAQEALSLDPSAVWIETNRAHALLFLGRFEEAKAVYLGNKGRPLGENRTFADAVRNDFSEFRKYGIDYPRMKEIEALLSP